MKNTGGGVIINTASNSVNNPSSGMGCYISAKSAVIALTRVLAVELAPDNIRVNCISPSLTDTAIFAGRPEGGPLPEHLKERIKRVPLGQRLIKPEEIAYAALYLVSDEASMTTGINLIIDGGSGIQPT
jgi:3-oxoacyl-[acyl-carrier protein] reductase